jgi:hypothetical protein
MTEEIAKYEVTLTPASMMMAAIEKGLDLEKVEKAMLLQERWEANEARKAYHLAMAKFKANPPEIEKDKHVSYEMTGGGTKSYNHASLANVTSKINSALSVQGLSATWDTFQGEGGRITVTCRITHEKGHSENTKLSASPDDSGKKNAIQAIGSTISYLERYTLLALTGLATHDMDDDAQGEPDFISEEQVKTIRDIVIFLERPEQAFCDHYKVESIEKIPITKYIEIMAVLKKSKKTKEDKQKAKGPVGKAEDDLKALIEKKNKELGVDEPGSNG